MAVALGTACSSEPLTGPSDSQTRAASAGGGPASNGGSSVNGPDYRKRDYPAGPYGTGVGATVENLAFLGWLDPVAADYDVEKLAPIELAEFYNPDGRSDIQLLWINASAVWCSVCRAEMEDIRSQGINAAFGAKGVKLIGTLFEDKNNAPATPMDLSNWGKLPAHSIDYPMLLDPSFKLGAFFTSDATPLNLLVDATTMRVIDATMGYSSDYWQNVDELLSR